MQQKLMTSHFCTIEFFLEFRTYLSDYRKTSEWGKNFVLNDFELTIDVLGCHEFRKKQDCNKTAGL
jgi:hypothetical protein